ncbi:MAG: glucosamine-6-phosphate deaminase [Elusimicrobia bacterium CG1_02_37_114]|nr:MAG: glucosamine-6-phosphate deaminase [Elusimicrobia bacterium CG1_02_37_114]PIZ13996.1 MAG: glucosamine-6-phosphate deaminase [Elusimicrobia bacterium CG_4_10_14_0_8_um_filter_37_32]
MRVIIVKDYDEISKKAASIIAEKIRKKPHFVLGVDVSDTIIGTYKELIQLNKKGNLDFSRVVTFNLDEYLGLAPGHPQSCRYFMDTNLLKQINIDERNIYIPNGLTKDPQLLCEKYEKSIKEVAGIDLQVLGIGTDGHIGFNEPGSSLTSRTRIKTLTEETVKNRTKVFKKSGDVPRFAITMGVGTIMESRMCMLLASGKRKAEILVKAIEGPVTASIPASMLQLHPNVIVIADKEASFNLAQKDYYIYVEKMTKQIGDAQI